MLFMDAFGLLVGSFTMVYILHQLGFWRWLERKINGEE